MSFGELSAEEYLKLKQTGVSMMWGMRSLVFIQVDADLVCLRYTDALKTICACDFTLVRQFREKEICPFHVSAVSCSMYPYTYACDI